MKLLTPRITKKMLERLEEKMHQISHASHNPRIWENISTPLRSAIKTAEKCVKPRAVYRLLPFLELDKKRVLTPAGPIESPMFSTQVRRSSGNRQVVFMLATLGPALENSADANRDILSQWVYDTVGSELMEMVADEVEHRLADDLAGERLEVARRFSPGYCDWSIEGQEVIFKALAADKVDVKLTSQKMMMPRKSISCVLASAEKVPVKIQCLLCAKKECPHRRRDDD